MFVLKRLIVKNKTYNQILNSNKQGNCKINLGFAISAVLHLFFFTICLNLIVSRTPQKIKQKEFVCDLIDLRISQPEKFVEIPKSQIKPPVIELDIELPEIELEEYILPKIKPKKKPKKQKEFVNYRLPSLKSVVKKTVAKTAKPKAKGNAKTENNNELILELLRLINKNRYYPRIAKKRGIIGTVEVKIFISDNGYISKYEIVSSEHSLLTKGVEKTMKEILNTKLNGQQCSFIVPIKFNLM